MKRIGIYILLITALCSCTHDRYFGGDMGRVDVKVVKFDTAYVQPLIADIVEDSVYQEVIVDCQRVFSDTRALQNELNTAFSRLVYLYPEIKVPTIYLSLSGMQFSTWPVNDSVMVVGADLYLGSDYRYYPSLVYNYQLIGMRPECIAGDVMSAVIFRTIRNESTQNRLLDQMIYRGKMMFLLSQLLPHLDEGEIMGYSREQYRWCSRNERALWNTLLDRRELYKTEHTTLSAYLNDGPFCSEIAQECPSRIGIWLGLRIVKSYIEHNQDVTIQQLMAESNSQYILENSFYKP